MTAGELIDRADALRPNHYPRADKLLWLQRLDGQLRRELLDTHEPAPGESAPDAAAEAPYADATRLLCPAPWDGELYTAYLFAQIDLNPAEIEKYDQSAALFAAAWRQYADWLNRARRPLGLRRWRF